MTTKDSVQLMQQQIMSVLEQLTDSQYHLSLDIFNGSTVGEHVRHIFDFYNCICFCSDGVDIDYNCRERNPLIESERKTAIASFSQLVNEISRFEDTKVVNVITDFSTDESEERPVVLSSIGRELMYAYDHAVHHLAIIKMGIKSAFPEIVLNDHIGIAPSTIKYQSKN